MGCITDYYYKNKKMCHCPRNTFVQKKKNKNYCIDCYKNCATCKDIGNESEMKCESCPDGYIKHLKNCYKIANNEIKSFYKKGESGEVSSCLQSFNLYIKENTNECISMTIPTQGYFISNSDTGLISKCHSNCKTCSSKPTNDRENCDECLFDYLILQEGNCINNCNPGSYPLSDGTCQQCHDNCLTCNSYKKYDESENLISMGCLKCKDNMIFVGSSNPNEGFCFPKIKYEETKITFDIHELKNSNSQIEESCLFFNKSIFYGENQCISKPDNTYYINSNIGENTGIIEYCNQACETCIGKNETNNTNCLDCAQGYFKTEDSDTNCILPNSISSNYYKNYLDNKYYKCYYSCSSCYDGYGSYIEDMNCIFCKEGFYKLNGTNNCYNISLSEEGYYLKNGTFYNCHYSCLKCNDSNEENHNCLECAENYYNLENDLFSNNCYNNELINEGYYLSKEVFPYIWKKCFQRCETCYSFGNINNMNCLSCKSNLINNKTNKEYYFKLSNGNCIEACPDRKLLTPIGDCVVSCPNGTYEYSLNNTCLEICPKNFEINKFNDKCIFKKFEETTTINEFKNQVSTNISYFVNSSAIINGSDFLAVVLSSDEMDPEIQLRNGISAIVLGDCTERIKEYYNISNDENLIVLNMESKNDKKQKNETNNDDKSFNLGKNTQIEIYDFSGKKLNLSVCKEDIKVMKYIGDVEEELNIQSAKDLASIGVDVFNANDGFFNDLCKKFDNGKDIILNDRRNDIYQNATFCQEGCIYSGVDYQLMAANCICDTNFVQGQIENKTKNEMEQQNEVVNFKSITKSFMESLLDFNIDVIKCSNLAFNKEILVNNIGFYFLLILFLLQIIFLIIYIIKKLKSIKHYMIIIKENQMNVKIDNSTIQDQDDINKSHDNNIIELSQNSKIIKKRIKSKFYNNRKKMDNNFSKNNESSNINNSKKKICFDDNNIENMLNLNSDKEQKNKDKNILKNNFFISNNSTPIINIQTQSGINNNNNTENKNIKKLKKSKSIKSTKSGKKRFKKKIKEIKFETKADNENNENVESINSKNSLKKKVKFKLENIKNEKNNINMNLQIDNRNKNEINKLLNIENNLQDMDFEEAKFLDKRSYFNIFWSYLVDTQIILGTFCTENYLYLFVIKLSFFAFTFQISFFLNALFYSDKYISNAYYNNGVLDFVSGLPKSIYSSVATLITTNLLRMLSNNKSELIKIIKEKRYINNYIELIDLKLEKLRKKLVIYFIIVILLGLFFLYYVTCFCAVYKYSQKYWFIGCLESFGIDSLISIIICIFLSLLRYISIKKGIKYCFILANIIEVFL